MSMGYVDPVTKKYVKSAGNLSTLNTPIASKDTDGLMSQDQAIKLDKSYTTDNVATTAQINALFN